MNQSRETEASKIGSPDQPRQVRRSSGQAAKDRVTENLMPGANPARLQHSSDNLPEGSITINQHEYVVETLSRWRSLRHSSNFE
eukprot:3073422-Amphidinium_carterae.1